MHKSLPRHFLEYYQTIYILHEMSLGRILDRYQDSSHTHF